MTPRRLYFILLGSIGLLVVGIGALLWFGNTYLHNKSQKLVDAKLDNYTTEELERVYQRANKDLESYRSLGETLSKVLPKEKDQAMAVRELYKIASETNISIESVNFAASTLGQKATGTTKPNASITQAKQVEGIDGVLGIDISISAKGIGTRPIAYNDMITFLQKVELNRRSMMIKEISISPSKSLDGVTFTATLTTFVKP